MALSMAAILRINAQTSGTGELREMDRALRRIGPGAEGSVGGVQRLSQATRAMGSILGTIGLAALTAQMVAYGRVALQAGEDMNLLQQRLSFVASGVGEVNRIMALATEGSRRFALSQFEATEAITNMYGKLKPMGVGLSEVRDTFVGVNNAARMSGATIDDVREVIRQLGQGIGQTALNGEELKTIMERMPPIGAAIVTAFNNIARSKGLTLITRQRADELVAEVRDGEKRQTRVIEEEGRNRIRAAEKETESLLREIADRYEKERRLLNDKYDDQEELERDRKDKEKRSVAEGITENYDVIKEANEKIYKERLEAIENDQQLSDEAKKKEREALDEEYEYVNKTLRKNEQKDMEGMEERFRKEERVRQRQARDRREREEKEVRERQRAEEEAARQYAEQRKATIDQNNKDELDANKRMADELVKGIQDRTIKTVGDLKKLGAELKLTPDVIFAAMKELSNMKVPPPTEMQQLTAAIKDLNIEVGEKLLPTLKPFIVQLTGMLRAFNGMPEPVKATAVAVGLVAGAVTAIATAAIAAAFAVSGATEAIRRMKQVAAGPSMPVPVDLPTAGRGRPSPTLPPAAPPWAVGPGKAAPPVPEPPKGMWKSFLDELGAVGRAVGGLAKQFGLLFAEIGIALGRAVPAIGRLGPLLIRGLALGGILTAVQAAFTGLVAWIGSVAVPAILAFFSGPPGWVTLGVAAVVAGALLFRKPITEFFSWIGKAVGDWAQPFTQFFDNNVIKPLINLWNKIKEPVSNLFTNIAWLAGQAFNGLIALGYKIFIEPWVQLWSVIKEPVSDLFEYYTTGAQVAWDSLVKLGYNIFLKPWVELWGVIKKPVLELFGYFSAGAKLAWDSLVELGYEIFIKPWTDLWGAIRKPAGDAWDYITKLGKGVFDGIIKWIYDKFIKPWEKAWSFITMEPSKFKKAVIAEFEQIKTDTIKIFEGIGNAIKKPFEDIINGLFARIQSFIASNKNAINEVILVYNRVAENINRLPTIVKPFGMRDMPILQPVTAEQAEVPRLARGGWISSPTLAWVGDTGRAEGEYAIPGEMMPAAMAAWSQGARGDALVAAMRSGGGGPAVGGGGLRTQLNLTLQAGPVLQQPDGSQWVQREELAAVAEAVFAAAVEANNSSAARSVSGWS